MHSWLRIAFLIFLTLLLPASPLQAAGAPTQTMEQQVRAVEQRWLANENRPDVVQSILAEDFIHVLPVGFITKAEHLRYLDEHPHAFPGAKHFEGLRVRIYGQVAVATGIVSALPEPGSKPSRTAFSDVFVKRAGKWVAVNAQELPLP